LLNLRPGIAIVVIERTYYREDNQPVETADMIITPPFRPRFEIPVDLGAE
jgi:DNA-binding GntR family transcriptional regulator